VPVLENILPVSGLAQQGKLYKCSITFRNTGGLHMSIITIRVAREIKEKLEKYNVNVSETVRKLLDRYLVELELKDLAERLELLKERLSDKIDPRLVAKLVREGREKR
jgi:hypothetical protein